ncbi:hypothetical protein KAM354_30850 [Aeromonas caviae]|nr:hypothetical protein KAM354_30850 [Aeromonas caviae]
MAVAPELVRNWGSLAGGPAAPRRSGAPGPTSRGIPAGGLRHPGAPVPERGRDLISLNLVA